MHNVANYMLMDFMPFVITDTPYKLANMVASHVIVQHCNLVS